MDRLWAPWRAQYILGNASKPTAPTSTEACFICHAVQSAPALDRENLLVLRSPDSLVLLNRYPYNNGHLLVAPCTHKAALSDLSDAELTSSVLIVREMVSILGRMLKPQGFNIGLNLGKSAGAGLPGHIHWHIVPRWDGDTNFMPVLSDTRVIIESLDSFYQRLAEEIQKDRHFEVGSSS